MPRRKGASGYRIGGSSAGGSTLSSSDAVASWSLESGSSGISRPGFAPRAPQRPGAPGRRLYS